MILPQQYGKFKFSRVNYEHNLHWTYNLIDKNWISFVKFPARFFRNMVYIIKTWAMSCRTCSSLDIQAKSCRNLSLVWNTTRVRNVTHGKSIFCGTQCVIWCNSSWTNGTQAELPMSRKFRPLRFWTQVGFLVRTCA